MLSFLKHYYCYHCYYFFPSMPTGLHKKRVDHFQSPPKRGPLKPGSGYRCSDSLSAVWRRCLWGFVWWWWWWWFQAFVRNAMHGVLYGCCGVTGAFSLFFTDLCACNRESSEGDWATWKELKGSPCIPIVDKAADCFDVEPWAVKLPD